VGSTQRPLTFSRLNSTNFPAFHSLLVKLREELTRSRDRFRSWPGLVPVASVKRSASGGRDAGREIGRKGWAGETETV